VQRLIYDISEELRLSTYFCKGFEHIKGRWELRTILNFFSQEMLERQCKLPEALFLIFSQFANIFLKKKINGTITN
jgi:hypothetical protein